ncbi:Hypothetical protein MSYG_1311 [Malassezia sympodialis ATCC 42132]|uniref:Uncharacterized protein n=1 Tax=Malassezia sympodialis (strain ATCC 42132) TaxID=1230383 RepID=A0A1M8A3C6_MALS4|nr:Hypothetical protein MSYG_1311 [Malassezia sympodialis ATCC 42132]
MYPNLLPGQNGILNDQIHKRTHSRYPIGLDNSRPQDYIVKSFNGSVRISSYSGFHDCCQRMETRCH